MITSEQYKEINALGLKDREAGSFSHFQTPVLSVAYDLGLSGVSIKDAKVITGFRFGGCPDCYVSFNHASNSAENGLSVYTDKDVVRAEFEERGNKKYYDGLMVDTGSDGESVILPFCAENWD